MTEDPPTPVSNSSTEGANLPDSPNKPLHDERQFHVWVKSIGVGDSEPIILPPVGVVIVAGANNVGKSTLLREISTRGALVGAPFSILSSIEFGTQGSQGSALEYFGERYEVEFLDDRPYLPGVGELNFGLAGLVHGDLAIYQKLVSLNNVDQRLQLGFPTSRSVDFFGPAGHPLQAVARRQKELDALRRSARDLFGITLTLDMISINIGLRIGKVDAETPTVEEVAGPYHRALSQLPWLSEQGDGVRSALGLMLGAVVGPPVLLFDEPEAFLHPPQAKELGKQLARLAQQEAARFFSRLTTRTSWQGY